MLLEVQRAFKEATLGQDAPLVPHVGVVRGPLDRRIAVYRNTVQAGLVDVLAAAYPVVERVVGRRRFRQLTRDYVIANLPNVPQLSVYGAGLAAFLETHDLSLPLAYLPDVARLEWARGEAYFAADAAPLDPAALAAVDPSRITDVVLKPHPAARVVVSDFPIHRIWSVNQPEVVDVPPVDMSIAEAALWARPQHHVMLRLISRADADFVRACQRGATLGQAAAQAFARDAGFDLQDALHRHLVGGTFTAVDRPPA